VSESRENGEGEGKRGRERERWHGSVFPCAIIPPTRQGACAEGRGFTGIVVSECTIYIYMLGGQSNSVP